MAQSAFVMNWSNHERTYRASPPPFDKACPELDEGLRANGGRNTSVTYANVNMIEDCLAVIMAGGDSRRMGCDKASLVLGEQTLLQRVADAMHMVFPQRVVSVRRPRTDVVLPQVCDTHVDAGPLAGLCAGLEHAAQDGVPWIFAVATDMPFVRPALIEQLAKYRAGVDAVVPLIDGHPQPLAAFYSIEALPVVRALATGEGKRSLRAVLERLQVAYVHAADLIAADPGLDSFIDLDTPEDLAKAKNQKEG